MYQFEECVAYLSDGMESQSQRGVIRALSNETITYTATRQQYPYTEMAGATGYD